MKDPKRNLTIKKAFSSLAEIELVYHYGSSLKNEQKTKDVDFGILLKKNVSSERRFEIYNILAEKLSKIYKKDVDIAFLNQSSPMLAYQVLQKGKLIYGEITRAKQFTVETMTRYFDYLPLHQFFVRSLEKRLGGRPHGG